MQNNGIGFICSLVMTLSILVLDAPCVLCNFDHQFPIVRGAMSSSSSVQQEQLPCASSNYFLDHKSSSSWTATWRGGRWTRKNLLLRVCVHRFFHFTHQHLSQYTALLSRPHRIEKEAAFIHHGYFRADQREKLWQEFFMDPSQWWDHRSEKVLSTVEVVVGGWRRFLVETGEALWLEDQRNPPWVAAEIAAMPPGTVQLNIFAWNQKLTKYVKDGQFEKAMQLFRQMQQDGVSPDKFTFVQVIKACAGLGRLEDGRLVHKQLIQSSCESDVFVGNSLVDMYAKCGSVEDACRVFNNLPSQNVVSWNAILGGCAMHGHGEEALKLFEQMCREGVQPNDITFVCLLSACSHAGLVDEGMRCFALMSTVYRISTTLEHYTCMVDLLGRAGHLQKAENMVMAMPNKQFVPAWMALLGTCRIHGDLKMAERVAKQILELEPENAAPIQEFSLLSSIYAAAGSRHLCENVEWQRKEKGAKKQLGHTWIEVNNEVHTFVVEDQDHPQILEICAELQRLSGLMHDALYRTCAG